MSNDDVFEEGKEIFRSMFSSTAKNPGEWLRYAEFMKKGADAIAEQWKSNQYECEPKDKNGRTRLRGDFGLAACYYLLAGLAIENLAKGILFARQPERIRNKIYWKLTKKLEGQGLDFQSINDTHDLAEILEVAEIRIHPSTKYRLDLLTKYIKWLARYPVAREKHGMGDALHKWRNDVGKVQDFVNHLYRRLQKVLKEMSEKYDQEQEPHSE